MKRKLHLTILVLFFAAGPAWAEDDAGASLRTRSFRLSYRTPERAAAVVRPLISAEGSVSIQPGTNTVVITDRPENLAGVAKALEQFDAPARPFRVELKVVAVSRAESPAAVPEDLKDLSQKLGAVLRFNSFEKMAEFNAEGKEGDVLLNLQVSDSYRADMTFGEHDPVKDVVRLQDVQISRVPPGGQGTVEPLLKRTSLNLKVGQTVILGAQRPESNRALMFVLVARRID